MGYASGGYIRPESNDEAFKVKVSRGVIVVPAWMYEAYGRKYLEALAGGSVDIVRSQTLNDLADDDA